MSATSLVRDLKTFLQFLCDAMNVKRSGRLLLAIINLLSKFVSTWQKYKCGRVVYSRNAQLWGKKSSSFVYFIYLNFLNNPAGFYLMKVNNGNHQNTFYALFWCFHCWIRKSKCQVGSSLKKTERNFSRNYLAWYNELWPFGNIDIIIGIGTGIGIVIKVFNLPWLLFEWNHGLHYLNS